jgi:two-component system, OmpR family, KDP operon response regulator KdpE
MKLRSVALIIDDEVQIRRLLRFALESAGHQVVEAETGQEGLMESSSADPTLFSSTSGCPIWKA